MNLEQRGISLYAIRLITEESHMPLYFEATKKSSLFTSPQNGPNSNGATILKLSSLCITSANIQKNIRNNKCYCEFYYIIFFFKRQILFLIEAQSFYCIYMNLCYFVSALITHKKFNVCFIIHK